jgi:hypothetical protein
MSCDVSLGDYDGEEAGFFHAVFVVARKPHQCCECRSVIQPNERYERVSGKWNGEIDVYRFCAACSEIQREFSDGGRSFGVMWESFREEWAHGANLQACLNRVSSVAAKSKLREQWQRAKGLA